MMTDNLKRLDSILSRLDYIESVLNHDEAGLAAVNERLASAKTQVDTLKTKPITSALPIGTVIQSFLTSESFQSEYGDGWMLCDGSSCEGTAYAKLSKRQTLPDLRGKFLRTTGGKAANLGLAQDQATAVNGLVNSASNVSQGRMNTTVKLEKAEKTGVATEDIAAFVDGKPFWVNFYGGRNEALADGRGVSPQAIGWKNLGHSHTVPAQVVSFEANISDQSAEAQTMTGDPETRPENVSVNTFIRVD